MRPLALFACLNALDVASTAYALTLPGWTEANALAAGMGAGMWALKAASTVTVIAVAWRLRHRCAGFVSRWAIRGGNTVLAIVVLGNVAQLILAFVVC